MLAAKSSGRTKGANAHNCRMRLYFKRGGFSTMKRQLSVLAAAAVFAVVAGQGTAAPDAASSYLPDVSALALDAPVAASRKLDRELFGATGEVDVVVQLAGAPLVVANGENARRVGGLLSKEQQKAHSRNVSRSQDDMLARLLALGGREIGRVRIAYNAVIVRIDAEQLSSVAGYSDVVSIQPVREYEMSLSETVPYIGAASAQDVGITGEGVTVAVLDSGIDYTHFNLGGAGTAAAYAAAYGTSTADPLNTTRDGLFPTAKVIAGYDFVGEVWPNGPIAPDEDPIDFEGHGTHVADIIAGESTDGTHVGVAPGAKLMAVKVCSAVASSCNGVALLQGMDFALDPNGDGCMDDAADVINMSLGSSYGQVQDDLSFATTNASKAGVVVVVSAGNSGDRPFITGSPSTSPEALSVAQTNVPTAVTFPLVVTGITPPTTIANTNTVEWAPVGSGFSGEVVRLGRACPADSVGPGVPADPFFNGNNPAGKVALIDRGSCAISLKVDYAADAGAIAVIIANNVSGDPPSFSFGGGDTFVPTLIITLADGNRIKAGLGTTGVNPAVTATVSSAVTIPLVGSIVASSSRGPSYSFGAIKPNIGAPGASVSAVAGSGTGETAFGGTSGAAPMVSGAAALLLSDRPKLTPTQVKALLANTAETTIYTNPATQPGVLAPITRIGGGEVRVNRALGSETAMWDHHNRTPALSFGYHSVSYTKMLKRTVRVRNLSHDDRTYSIATSFRYADDAASGAVTVSAPASINVDGRGSATFDVWMTIDPTKLNNWPWATSGGSGGGTGSLLQTVEYDGYVTLTGGGDSVHLPWHVLPKKAALVQAIGNSVTIKKGETSAVLPFANLTNAQTGRVEAFALLGTSPKIPKGQLPGPGDNEAVIDLQAVGARLVAIGGGAFGLQVGISTHGIRAHPAYPAEFDVYIDSTGDLVPDYVLYTVENGTFASSGQTIVVVLNLATGVGSAFFFADTDLESGNMIMTAPLSAIGATPATKLNISVYAFDNYFTGNLTDYIELLDYTPGAPRFDLTGIPATGVPPLSVVNATVTAIPANDAASPSQSGFLFLYRDANKGLEADAIKVKDKNNKGSP
jgi:subtilisin family serine protease